MDPILIIAGVLIFAAIFFVILWVASLSGLIKHPVDRRISSIHQAPRTSGETPILSEEKTKSLVASLGQRVAPTDAGKRSDSKQRLLEAGYYRDGALHTYWGLKILFAVVLGVAVLILYVFIHKPLTQVFLPMIFALGVGMFIPDIFLSFKVRSRKDQIFRALPDMLDLMVVCIESGLGLDAAMNKVSEEFHLSNPILSNEVHITCAAVRLGQPRSEALRELGERTGVPDLKSLAAVLIQAERFGTSLGQGLRVHSDDMRTRRRQRAEELAAKTTVKLLVPLVMFIFPSIFVVLLAPAVLKIIDTFKNTPM